jgi:glycosyltransferase involved in cell wall biosynthesis
MALICVLTSVHRPFDQRIFYKQARSLAAAGYDVTLLAPADFSEQVRDGVRVLGIPRPHSRWARPGVWWSLLRQAVRLRPNLVHLHDPELLLLAPFLRRALGPHVPIVYDVHEYFVDSIAHKVWIPPRLRNPAAWLARSMERTLGRVVNGLILVIEDQAPLYADWQAARAVIHNYPEIATFADPTPLPEFPADRFRMIYIGSLYARRGIMIMLEALVHVVPQAPEALLILGGAFESEAFRAQVEAFITGRGLQDNVVLLGWIDHARLKDYLVSADVAWLPGLQVQQYRRRSISTKQLEAMLMGLPIVSSDHPHRRLFIEEANCGFSVGAEDSAAHAQAVLWLYHHPEARRAMGARGRRLVLERYSWEAEVPLLVDFYNKLLDRERKC